MATRSPSQYYKETICTNCGERVYYPQEIKGICSFYFGKCLNIEDGKPHSCEVKVKMLTREEIEKEYGERNG